MWKIEKWDFFTSSWSDDFTKFPRFLNTEVTIIKPKWAANDTWFELSLRWISLWTESEDFSIFIAVIFIFVCFFCLFTFGTYFVYNCQQNLDQNVNKLTKPNKSNTSRNEEETREEIKSSWFFSDRLNQDRRIRETEVNFKFQHIFKVSFLTFL